MSATPAPEFQAVIRTNTDWIIAPAASGTVAAETRAYGQANDQSLVGDWNGDGLQDLVVVRSNTEGGLSWIIDLGEDNVPDIEHKFGLQGDVAVLGDWDANGTDDPGVVRKDSTGNTWKWHLDRSHVIYANPTPRSYGLLSRGDRPIVGDWNGDGRDDVGVTYEDRSTGYVGWLLDTNGDSFQDVTRQFGLAGRGDIPIAGDWNGDRRDDLAVARPNSTTGELVWYFDTNGDTAADRISSFGRIGDLPIAVERTVAPSIRDTDDRLSEATNLGSLTGTISRSNSISPKTDVDLYRFSVNAGQTITFDIDTPPNGPPGLGSYLRIFDAQGRELAANNDRLAPGEQPGPNSGSDGFDSFIPYQFNAAGTYFVGVSNWQHRNYNPVTGEDSLLSDPNWLTGSYSLVVTVLGNIVKPTASFASGVLTVTGVSTSDDVTVIDPNGRISVDAYVNGMTMPVPIRSGTSTVPSLDAATVARVVINGNSGNDILRNQTAKPSTIRGGAGDDTIYGGAAVDLLYGDSEKDVIYGGDAGDSLYGGDGPDSLYGAQGDDILYGESGDDLLVGMQDDDRLYGGDHNDRLFGGGGLDGLVGGLGENYLQGESGADRFLYRPDFDTVVDAVAEDAAIALRNFSASWSGPQIDAVDAALHLLHMKARSTTLLKTYDDRDLTLYRSSSFSSTTGTVLGRNYGEGNIHFTNAAFTSSTPVVHTVLHEIGHNWDEENPNWVQFYSISWQYTSAGFVKRTGTEFVSDYAMRSPLEDFAESFAFVIQAKTSAIPRKSALINNWIASL